MRLTIVLVLLLTSPVNGSWMVYQSFTAATPEEATAIGATFVGQDAFQLQGSNGVSSIFYSNEFPITVWGDHRNFPGTWENRSGMMQRITYSQYPDDWFDIVGFPPYGSINLRHWHILKSPLLGTQTTYDVWPWFGLEVRTQIGIHDGSFYLYRASYEEPGLYTVGYRSGWGVIVPEPDTRWLAMLGLFISLLMVLWARVNLRRLK